MRLFSKNLLMSKPSEQYEVLDSLKINSKCFFILDEVEFTSWDYSAEITVQIDKDLAYGSSLFAYGSTASGTAITVTCLYPNYKNFGFYSGNKVALSNPIVEPNKLLRAVIERTSETISATYVYKDGKMAGWGNITSDFIPSKGEFRLFGSTETYSIFKGNFYNFTLTIEGDTVIDLVPAKRNSDGVLGLLNKVDNKFYENEGSGIIEGGEEIA